MRGSGSRGSLCRMMGKIQSIPATTGGFRLQKEIPGQTMYQVVDKSRLKWLEMATNLETMGCVL